MLLFGNPIFRWVLTILLFHTLPWVRIVLFMLVTMVFLPLVTVNQDIIVRWVSQLPYLALLAITAHLTLPPHPRNVPLVLTIT